MPTKTHEGEDQFRNELFDFYIDKQNSLENFKWFERILGLVAISSSLLVGGPFGVSLAVVSASTVGLIEKQISGIELKNHVDHQKIIRSVYDSRAKKK